MYCTAMQQCNSSKRRRQIRSNWWQFTWMIISSISSVTRLTSADNEPSTTLVLSSRCLLHQTHHHHHHHHHHHRCRFMMTIRVINVAIQWVKVTKWLLKLDLYITFINFQWKVISDGTGRLFHSHEAAKENVQSANVDHWVGDMTSVGRVEAK